MNDIEELSSLSDAALTELDKMFKQQYKLGFEYATECWGGNIRLPEVKTALSKVLVKLEPSYLRALIKARKK
jgi:hypothetical protein